MSAGRSSKGVFDSWGGTPMTEQLSTLDLLRFALLKVEEAERAVHAAEIRFRQLHKDDKSLDDAQVYLDGIAKDLHEILHGLELERYFDLVKGGAAGAINPASVSIPKVE